ncbi:hypothetical protein [Streptomyces sp. NPDC004266]|uniref:hypothetical protein n=1 Tax=Streptomyces sp. NPDC004266 TaxID=3364693 RepID=UPI00369BB211
MITTKDHTGRLIGAAFGLVFVQADAGALPTAVATPPRLLAIAAPLGVVVLAAIDAPGTAVGVTAGILPGVLLLASVRRSGRPDPAASADRVLSGSRG